MPEAGAVEPKDFVGLAAGYASPQSGNPEAGRTNRVMLLTLGAVLPTISARSSRPATETGVTGRT